MGIAPIVRSWVLGTLLAVLILGIPGLYYRYTFDHARRLRIVTEGKFYRSGQLTSAGFRDAQLRYQIKTVINLQEDVKEPRIKEWAFGRPSVQQSEVLAGIGVNSISLDGGLMDSTQAGGRPVVIDEFLEVIDGIRDQYWKKGLPHAILIHCAAGLHRTGLFTAIYRIEYENRSLSEVIEELKANGFGNYKATDANDYIKLYLLDYRKGFRWPGGKPAKPSPKPAEGGGP